MTGATFTFTTNHRGLDHLLHSPNGGVGQSLTRLGNQVVNRAKELANVDTGNMRSRIEFRLENDGQDLLGIVAARTDYSYYVHEGNGYYGGNPFLTDALRDVVGGGGWGAGNDLVSYTSKAGVTSTITRAQAQNYGGSFAEL